MTVFVYFFCASFVPIFVDVILPPIPRVMQLLAEIEKVKDAQLAGYAKGGGGSSAATNEKIHLNLNALAALDAADFYNDGMLCVKCVNMCHFFYVTILLLLNQLGVKTLHNEFLKVLLINISCSLTTM